MIKIKPMAKNSTYISELRTLLDVYGAAVIAKLLGVTERGIDYWLSEKPKVPRSETQRTIHELFLKHQFGEDIRDSEKPGLKDELLQSYKEQVELLKREVNFLKVEIKRAAVVNRAVLLTNQDMLVDLVAHLKKRPVDKVAFEAGKANKSNFDRALQMDNHADNGGN